jgi:hypothetical protein
MDTVDGYFISKMEPMIKLLIPQSEEGHKNLMRQVSRNDGIIAVVLKSEAGIQHLMDVHYEGTVPSGSCTKTTPMNSLRNWCL